MKILYDQINQREDALAERAYAPWVDMEALRPEHGMPLYSLESEQPLACFDLIGFTLPYETLYTNTLNILDLAGIPVRSSERDESHPIIIAGGHAATNPEPMHAFIDAFVIGEGEEVIHDVVNAIQKFQSAPNYKRDELLVALAQISGVYVPKFYETTYLEDGTVAHTLPTIPEAPKLVNKRIVAKLLPPPVKFIVPNVEVIHNRVSVEIMRGCTRGCRFCQAGMITRPVRKRSVQEVVDAADAAVRSSGFEELALMSLSSSDYTYINELVDAISKRFEGRKLSVNLPSLRIESVSVDLMDKLKQHRTGGFTLAPEAASERMRRIINEHARLRERVGRWELEPIGHATAVVRDTKLQGGRSLPLENATPVRLGGVMLTFYEREQLAERPALSGDVDRQQFCRQLTTTIHDPAFAAGVARVLAHQGVQPNGALDLLADLRVVATDRLVTQLRIAGLPGPVGSEDVPVFADEDMSVVYVRGDQWDSLVVQISEAINRVLDSALHNLAHLEAILRTSPADIVALLDHRRVPRLHAYTPQQRPSWGSEGPNTPSVLTHERSAAVEAGGLSVASDSDVVAAGIELAVASERAAGCSPRVTGKQHPAYDLQVGLTGDASARFIRVMGLDGAWDRIPIVLGAKHYNAARTFGRNFWLYVVEHALDPQQARVHRIHIR